MNNHIIYLMRGRGPFPTSIIYTLEVEVLKESFIVSKSFWLWTNHQECIFLAQCNSLLPFYSKCVWTNKQICLYFTTTLSEVNKSMAINVLFIC